MKAIAVAALTLILLGCASSEPRLPAPLVDIATVLASPDAYDGKLVRISGAAVVRFEASFICPTPDLIDSDGTKNCLWLFPGEMRGKECDIRPFHGKLVEIVGRFDKKRFGHMGGSIAAVWGKILGSHGLGDIPPPPPPPPPPASSANNSFKPKPLRGSA